MTAAKFQGVCAADCGHPIREGERIEFLDDLNDTGWRHATCPDAADEAADRAALAQPRCARCGANHPGEC